MLSEADEDIGDMDEACGGIPVISNIGSSSIISNQITNKTIIEFNTHSNQKLLK